MLCAANRFFGTHVSLSAWDSIALPPRLVSLSLSSEWTGSATHGGVAGTGVPSQGNDTPVKRTGQGRDTCLSSPQPVQGLDGPLPVEMCALLARRSLYRPPASRRAVPPSQGHTSGTAWHRCCTALLQNRIQFGTESVRHGMTADLGCYCGFSLTQRSSNGGNLMYLERGLFSYASPEINI